VVAGTERAGPEGSADVKPFRVLSLDGGGMRGIYTAAFLDRLVIQFARTRGKESLDLGKGFDLITGTSTGAIVGCALAVGRPMGDIVKMYRDHGRQIFPHRIKGTFSAIWRMFVGGIGARLRRLDPCAPAGRIGTSCMIGISASLLQADLTPNQSLRRSYRTGHPEWQHWSRPKAT